MSTNEINLNLEKCITEYLVNKYPLNDYLTKSGNKLMKKRLYIQNNIRQQIIEIITIPTDIKLYEKAIELRKIRH